MQKNLVLCMVFAVFSMAFTNCTKSKDAYEPDRPEQDAQKLYSTNFKAYVGGSINSNVDWGFGATATRGFTRAGNVTGEWDKSGYATYFYATFFETVQSFFPEGAVCTSSDWLSYEFSENAEYCNLQLVYANTSMNDEIGLYYYDPATEKPSKDNKTVTLISNLQDNDGDLDYYLQFNRREEGGMWFGVSTTDGYKLWNGQSPAKRIQCRTFTLTMDRSYRFGFYVKNKDTGKTYYSNHLLNDNQDDYSGALIGVQDVGNIVHNYVIGLSDDGKPGCNIMFVLPQKSDDGTYPTPVKPEPEPQPELKWYRIIAEDLNAHDLDKDGEVDDTDFDFNDIVLDAALTPTGAKCILQAAGATLKIRIDGNDNLEVHKMFGVDQKVMVNTHAEKKGLAHADKDSVEFELAGSYQSLDDIKIEVFRQNRWMTLHAPKGDAASKIAVGIDFEWPDERQSLKEKYPDFPKYVRDGTDIDSWWKKW